MQNEFINWCCNHYFQLQGRYVIPGDQPAVRKPLLEWGLSLGWQVACGPRELVSHQAIADNTKSRAVCDQSCLMIHVHASGWRKAAGAVGASVMYHPKTQLCAQPAIPAVKLGALLSSSGKLFESKLCSCYRDLKVLVWGSWGQRGELVLCSMISSMISNPTPPTAMNKARGARPSCAVNAKDIPEHQHVPAKGTTANSVSLFTLLLAKCHYLLPTWARSQIFWSCRLGEETEDWFSYFFNAIPFLYRLTESVLGTGQLMQPGTIICSQFKTKFLLVPSQIAPSVKATLCGLCACCQPASPLHLLLGSLHPSFTHAHTPRPPRHTHSITSPLHVQAGGRYLPSATEQLLSRLCSLPTGVLLLQLLIPELT